MCHIWQKQSKYKELTVSDIDNFFSDKLLGSFLERINLTGGEPTMYPWLLDVVKIFINRCRKLQNIDMPTNGFDTPIVLESVETMLAQLFHTDIKLCVTVSVDGVGETAEKVRNVPDAFKKIDRTIKGLIELKDLYKTKLDVSLNATVSRLNIDSLEDLRTYALSNRIGINFTPAAVSEIGVESIKRQNEFLMNQQEKEKVILFFEKLMKNSEVTKPYGDFVINWLKGKKRLAGCVFRQRKAVLVEPTGDIYLCGNFKQFRIGNFHVEPFTKIWRKANGLFKYDSNKCSNCASNCYFG